MFGCRFNGLACLLPLLGALAGCVTVSPSDCSRPIASPAREPRNFGVVLAKDGEGKVLRGAELRDCGEVAYLRKQGVRSILELNASRTLNPRMEGGFEVKSVHLCPFTVGRAGSCSDVRSALTYLEDSTKWPIYVHCSQGRDRTGYIIGMFERETLQRTPPPVLKELAQFGHAGVWSLLFGQIDRELASTAPECGQGVPP